MQNEIYYLTQRLDKVDTDGLEIIKWAAPIVSFGDPARSKIATLGLNPSDKEFNDNFGNELRGQNRRFHSLKSLGLNKWAEISKEQIYLIVEQCRNYFSRNPYDIWFKKLDFLISGNSISYYFPSFEACHLDLVPYSTRIKWGSLSKEQQRTLLSDYGDILGEILNSSTISVIILNGMAVVKTLSQISDIEYTTLEKPSWKLKRSDGKHISGFSYEGAINRIGSIILNKKIIILGFNHNIQSSFGVTAYVQSQIRTWITEKTKQLL